MGKDVQILFGPPGTGKTTRCLDVVDDFLATGGDPTRVVFSSYTRQAATEARTRAAERFGCDPDDLPYFRTLHSLAFHQLGLQRTDVLRTEDYRDVAHGLGLGLSGTWQPDQPLVPGSQRGDECLLVYAWHRARQVPLAAAWRAVGSGQVGLPDIERFVAALNEVKAARHRLDFADMLDQCHAPLGADLVVLDEAQDLSVAQWALARRLAATSPRVLVAGDDDQAIYDFAGADSRVLRNLVGQRHVLTQSHRLAVPIHQLAQAMAQQIKQRVPKQYRAASHAGDVRTVATLEHLSLDEDGQYLLLARHNHQLQELVTLARTRGLVYHVKGKWSTELPAVRLAVAYERLRRGEALTPELADSVRLHCPGATWRVAPGTSAPVRWHAIQWPWEGRPEWYTALSRLDGEDVAYIRALRRRGVPLRGPGTVRISTIHGAKGAEADHVVLLTDISSRSYASAWRAGDGESRVWYVGATRARHTLTLVRSMSPRRWPGWPALGIGV